MTEEIKRECGVYKLINLVNGKIYVGSTKDLYERKWQHFNDLKRNKHYNTYLQNSWNKYKEENFKFEVIEYIEDINLLLEREQYWINFYNVIDKKYGYNIQPIAGSNLGSKLTEKHKEKIRNSHYGIRPSEETKRKQSKAREGKVSNRKGCVLTEETKIKISNNKKGTQNGENNPFSKLTDKNVLQIKEMLLKGEKSQTEIAELFDISISSVSLIKRGKTWTHIILNNLDKVI